jgi:hypothetical protein
MLILSVSSHIAHVQQSHVDSGYHIGKCRLNMPSFQNVLLVRTGTEVLSRALVENQIGYVLYSEGVFCRVFGVCS